MDGLLDVIHAIIVYPLEVILGFFIYDILLKSALHALYALEQAFNYVLGSAVERILFGVVIKDGEVKFNFFASDSPLRRIYLVCAGIGGTLLSLSFALSVMSTLMSKNKRSIVRKSMITLSSGSVVFVIPVIFLTILSLFSSFSSMITGTNVVVGEKSMKNYKTNLSNISNKILNSNFANSYEKSVLYTKGFLVENAENKVFYDIKREKSTDGTNKEIEKVTKTNKKNLDMIYDDFIIHNSDLDFGQRFKKNKNHLQELINLLYNKNNNGYNLETANNKLNEIVSSVTIGKKNQALADDLSVVNNYFSKVNQKIRNFKNDSKNILDSFEPNLLNKNNNFKDVSGNKKLKKTILIWNFKYLFTNYIYGKIDAINDVITNPKTNPTNNSFYINGLKNLSLGITFILNDSNYGTTYLFNSLSVYPESDLVTNYFQLATGSESKDWRNSSFSEVEWGGMLLLGTALILGTCAILFLAIVFGLVRIFDIALLFVISPIPVFISAIDDGERLKLWIKATVGEIIAIFGLILTLRFVGPLGKAFKSSLETLDITNNVMKMLLVGLFYAASLLAAYQATLKMHTIFGVGDGVSASMNTGRITGATTAMASQVGSKGLLYSKWATKKPSQWLLTKTKDKDSGKSSYNFRPSSIAKGWSNRIDSGFNTMTDLSFGKVGSKKSKYKYWEKKYTKKANKDPSWFKKEDVKKSTPSSTNNSSANNSPTLLKNSLASDSRKNSFDSDTLKDNTPKVNRRTKYDGSESPKTLRKEMDSIIESQKTPSSQLKTQAQVLKSFKDESKNN